MSAGLIVMHPQGVVIIADSRKICGREIVSDRSRKVFVFERVVVLHVGYAGQEGELESLMFRLEMRAKEWDAESLAWQARDCPACPRQRRGRKGVRGGKE